MATREKAILKCSEGLIQLRRCPVCNYMVKESDVIFKRQPTTLSDSGEVDRCIFCNE